MKPSSRNCPECYQTVAVDPDQAIRTEQGDVFMICSNENCCELVPMDWQPPSDGDDGFMGGSTAFVGPRQPVLC